jgi:hypothetical protein
MYVAKRKEMKELEKREYSGKEYYYDRAKDRYVMFGLTYPESMLRWRNECGIQKFIDQMIKESDD